MTLEDQIHELLLAHYGRHFSNRPAAKDLAALLESLVSKPKPKEKARG